MIERRVMKVGFVFDRPLDMATNELGGNEHVGDASWIGTNQTYGALGHLI